jgi:hypothetical protein
LPGDGGFIAAQAASTQTALAAMASRTWFMVPPRLSAILLP